MPGFLRRLWAFVRRDLGLELSYRLRFVFQIYGIVFSVTMFYYISRLLPGSGVEVLERYGGNYFPFVLVGIAFLGFMTTGLSIYAGSIREAQMMGTLEAMLVTPTPLSTIVIASALWTYLRASLLVLLYLAVGSLFGAELGGANLPAALLVLLLAVLAFSALGVLSAAFTLAFKRGDPVSAVFGGLSGLLGGAFFPVELLPEWLRALAELIPLKHALEGMRGALLSGLGPSQLLRPIGALAGFAGLLLPLGVIGFRLAVRRAKRDGSLAQY